MTLKVKVALAVATAALVGGCASQPKNITAAYVSPVQYADYSCPQITAEMDGVSKRTVELYDHLQNKADNDSAEMAIGIVLFWPALLMLNGGDGPEAQEYAHLKGEYKALDEVAGKKSCTVTTRSPETIIKEKEEQKQKEAESKGAGYPT
ncbi:hypothetical protein SAMN06265365_1361 [Tistlia consotensis]|uniref:Metal ABC transporter ATP-binding protein n=1 Tax=Tistlia consotensis USBA 355 TaxID=560819 RepID=A0A1Y6CU20_9PROT|nr:metal ABC transporter ATP-binding protein [Tistlia consotensis]SMF78068.1 hypothetical protein SAMN05428998_1382 [Tistlia consotensis USBA 355]SNS17691.1 hypothetical protein SAMN06265365_1361 [Tistlia consotensis]